MRWLVRKSDFEKMLNAPKDLMTKAMFRLLHDCAIRTGELISLRVCDIDFDNRSLTIVDSKKKKPFTLPLTTKSCVILAEYISVYRIKNWLFPSSRKESCHVTADFVQQCIKRYACKLDLNNWEKWCPRFFRRRFARNWILKKGSLTGLQDVLRHTQIGTTSIYVDSIRFESENSRKEFDSVMEF